MNTIVGLISSLIDLYMWVVIIYVVLSWLVSFDIVNTRNQFVRTIGDFLYRITEPALRPFRRVLPNLGGVDLSPLALIVLLLLVRGLMNEYLR
ncbi:MAG TPA: YggT family protein [Alphaproteobacteria bacterium]|nr:YggT family protein [Alphaproteobacteria bacterium]